MSARKLAGDFSIELEPFIIEEHRGGLVYERDMEQDRVVIVQNGVRRHVGWFPRAIGVVLPLSGMIHPDDISHIQRLVDIKLGLDPGEYKQAAEILDPGRNAGEQLAEELNEEYEE